MIFRNFCARERILVKNQLWAIISKLKIRNIYNFLISQLPKSNRFGISLENTSRHLLMHYRSQFLIFVFIFFQIHDFWKILCGREDFDRKPVVSTLFGWNPLKMDTNIIGILEITSTLRDRSFMMDLPFWMSRYAIITYSRRSRDSWGPYSV